MRFRGHTIGGWTKVFEPGHCGANTSKAIDFTWQDVDEVRLVVCQAKWPLKQPLVPVPGTCGPLTYIYNILP